MDNLTHSVVGLALGELVERSLPPETDPVRQRVRRKLLLVSCWAASNLPDLDLLLTPLAARPLGYLLHHRGYTHTLLSLIPQALALLALIWLLWPDARRLMRDSRPARLGTLFAVGLGLVLHLAMDYLNVYGVHPFAPFDGRWLYGDMVFIVEPVFWIALGVPLATMVTRRASRWLLFALLAAVPLYATARGYLQWGSLAGLAGLGLLLARAERRPGARGSIALATGVAAVLAVVAVQAMAVHAARQVVAAQLAARDPAERVLDVALSAFPANPVCWAFAGIESNETAGSYRLRRGVLSLAPALTPASACPAQLGGAPEPVAGNGALAWLWEERGSLAGLRDLRRSNCHLDAWLRFARAPSLDAGAATDVRFGPPGSPNFSTLPYAALAATPCPSRVPAWGYPRADLLGLP
jgi:inner membrane protein